MRSSCSVGIGALLLVAAPVLAQVPGPAAQPSQGAPSAPANFEVGFEERVRSESWDNLSDYSASRDDARHQWRFRTRAWVKAPLWSKVDLFVGVNNEARKLAAPDAPLSHDELVFENLYLDVRATSQTAVRVGRQNLMRGEGFILFEGNPLDGSRSIYSNAISVTHTVRPRSTVELLAISNPARDRYLPVIGDTKKMLSEHGETVLGAYYTNRAHAGADLQAYYLYKLESDDVRPATSGQYQPDRRVHTVGGRLAKGFAPEWTAVGEFAGQWGTQDPGRPVRGWGGYTYLKRAFGRTWRPAISAGVVALSGDDPGTATIEGFTPVLGRWPKWSELYIYTQLTEQGVAYWTNTWMWNAEVTAAPSASILLRGTFYHMGAFHSAPASGFLFATGTTRGDLFQARADVSLAGLLKAHLLYERMLPGSFYQRRDPGRFLRFEVSRSFQASRAIRALLH